MKTPESGMREPREFKLNINDTQLSVLEWPGESDPVLLLHATGFHSRCWTQVVKDLPKQHVYALDLRFHGASGGDGAIDWALMSSDVQTLIERLDLHHLVGVGHSIGGHLIARVAGQMGARFKHLLLIDPVILSRQRYDSLRRAGEHPDPHEHPVSRRKNRWRDAEHMYRRFSGKPPFNTWQPEVLRDYCDYALRPAADADYRQLACDPVHEASIYLNQSGNEIVHELLPLIHAPVTLLRSPPGKQGHTDLSTSPTWPGLASALPHCREIYLADCNHFIPMQDPALVARYIREAQGA
ncbi:MAG: alpha/beta hydrolase, partial [Halioglobus sp.]|nr:alpha/beta hydrolase [Halioglobus sp.]